MGTQQPAITDRPMPLPQDQSRATSIAHLSNDDGTSSLCGTPIHGDPAHPGQGRCIVCLDLATHHRHHTR